MWPRPAEAAALSAEAVLSRLGSSPAGLSIEQVEERRRQVGRNALPPRITPSWPRRLVRELTHLMALLLWFAGAMAFVAGMPELGWAIWAVVLFNAAFSFWQGQRADRTVSALAQMLPQRTRVRRGGPTIVVAAPELVPGDIVELAAGDRVPADVRLLEARAVRVDLSLLTGESAPVSRHADAVEATLPAARLQNLLFAGTTLVGGHGLAVVLSTGSRSELGRVSAMTATPRGATRLEREIAHAVRVISALALLVGAAVFLLTVTLFGLPPGEAFILAIGMVVANVPEGLLPTLTLSLAGSVRRLAARNALVRRMTAIDSLGATSVICTDKTGTLTMNRMTVERLWTGGKEIALPGRPGARGRTLLAAAALCCNDTGDPLEAALLAAAEAAGLAPDELRARGERRQELPFDADRKRMTVVVRAASLGRGDGWVAITKGAPLELAARCRDLPDEAARRRVTEAHHALVARGYRVLGVAMREVDGEQGDGEIERDLTFLGLLALVDPPRPGVEAAIRDCRRAGIRVAILTGDDAGTTRALAARIGLGTALPVASGDELDGLGDDALEALLAASAVIFARVMPEQKLRIVQAYQRRGDVVAVTGDGVNDAPALHAADVGVAMSLRGTDVAREAADIVLLDDNFRSIVDAIAEGRALEENIRRFTTYVLASNVPELVPFVAMAVFSIPPALTIMQILAVDLGTDIFPALALGSEPVPAGVLDEPPRPRGTRVLDLRVLGRAYLILGVAEAAASMAAFLLVLAGDGVDVTALRAATPALLRGAGPMLATYQTATTAALAAIVACQVGNAVVCRALGRRRLELSRRAAFWAALAIEVALLTAILVVPPLRRVFQTQPLPARVVLALLGLPLLMVAVEVLVRLAGTLTRRRTSGHAARR